MNLAPNHGSLNMSVDWNRALYFLHIPKTAGTTLYHLLDEKFDLQAVCPARFWLELLDLPSEKLPHYQFFRGHFGYPLHRFLNRDLMHMTMLRDPVDRAISYFEHVRRHPHDFFHKTIVSQQMEFADFIRSPETQFTVANLQTRTLAFDLDIRLPQVRSLNQFATNPFGLDGITETTILDIPDDELIEMAKQRLAQCVCVGLVEQFQESLWLMSYALGWYPMARPERLNQAPSRLAKHDLSAETLSDILQMNHLDRQLYGYAKQLFERRYGQMLKDLNIEADSEDKSDGKLALNYDLNDINTGIRSALALHFKQRAIATLSLVDAVDFEFSKAIQGQGWHRREGMIDQAIPFRWTGPEPDSTLSFYVTVNGSDYLLRLWVVNAISPHVLKGLTLWINEQKIGSHRAVSRGAIAIIQATIPAAIVQVSQGWLHLRLQVPQTLPLDARYADSHDVRWVGLAIHRIQVLPDRPLLLHLSETYPLEKERLNPTSTDMFPFPSADQAWTTSADLIQMHLQWGDRLIAPAEFMHRFPQAFYADSLAAGLIAFGGALPQWVVFHKGWVPDTSINVLMRLFLRFKPVFANSVFVIFSTAPAIPPIRYQSPHLKSLIETILQQVGDRLCRKLGFRR